MFVFKKYDRQNHELDSCDNNMERKELKGVVRVGVRWGKIVDQSANSNIIDLLVHMYLLVKLKIATPLLFVVYERNLALYPHSDLQ
jgi:hypothetical protein